MGNYGPIERQTSKNLVIITTMKFIERNWFKITIAIAVLVVALSIGYYSKQQVKESNIYLQTQCSNQAEKAFKDIGFPQKGDVSELYTPHYNQKLNKCFIEIDTSTQDGIWNELYDANELKIYASIGETSFNPETFICVFNQKDPQDYNHTVPFNCKSDDFDNFVKPYMEN